MRDAINGKLLIANIIVITVATIIAAKIAIHIKPTKFINNSNNLYLDLFVI